MMSKEENKKAMERHVLLTILDSPEVIRGQKTEKLQKMYAAIPLAQEYAEKCGGILRSISFGKFVGNVGITLYGGLDVMRRDFEEYRLLVENADLMNIDRSNEELEITFVFWDIYEVKEIRNRRRINHEDYNEYQRDQTSKDIKHAL